MKKSYIALTLIVLLFGIYVVPRVVDRFSGNDLETIGNAPIFVLTDQNNKQISNKDYLGKVYVVEFFFTSCPSICPIMNKNMVEVDHEFFGNPNFAIASITINPETDTPEVLKNHAQALKITSANWHFLTGNKDYIINLANKGFNLFVDSKSPIDGNFQHSGFFALVDKKGKIRCRKDQNGNPIIYYNGLEKSGVSAIKQDIKKLLDE